MAQGVQQLRRRRDREAYDGNLSAMGKREGGAAGCKNVLMAPDRRMIYPLLKSPLEVRNALGATPESHLLAQIIPPFPADATLTARDTNLEGDTVPNSEAANLRPDGHDRAGRFVA